MSREYCRIFAYEKTFSDHNSGLDVEYSIIADKHNLPKVA